jgi:uncharacterized protein YjcR
MKLTQEEEEKRMGLYKKGFVDKDIATKVGCHLSTITAWRRDRDLKSNGERKRSSFNYSYFTKKILEV